MKLQIITFANIYTRSPATSRTQTSHLYTSQTHSHSSTNIFHLESFLFHLLPPHLQLLHIQIYMVEYWCELKSNGRRDEANVEGTFWGLRCAPILSARGFSTLACTCGWLRVCKMHERFEMSRRIYGGGSSAVALAFFRKMSAFWH